MSFDAFPTPEIEQEKSLTQEESKEAHGNMLLEQKEEDHKTVLLEQEEELRTKLNQSIELLKKDRDSKEYQKEVKTAWKAFEKNQEALEELGIRKRKGTK